MENAKKEFLNHVKDRKIVCAKIGSDKTNFGDKVDWHYLKEGFSVGEFEKFLSEIDFEYDSGYGGQELFGVILFEDSYSDRGEYDGSEWWENHKMPTPKDLLPNETK